MTVLTTIKWEHYLILAIVITIVSHIPRLITNGAYFFGSAKSDRVLSTTTNFWTPLTITLHAITVILLILAYITWNNK